MAAAIQVFGPALVRTGTGTTDALEDLGYSINGVQIIEESLTLDVHGDQNGGDAGVPLDIQYMGAIHRIQMDLSKWDATVAAKIFPHLKGGTAGQIGTIGSLLSSGSQMYRLLISPTTGPRNYLAATPSKAPVELNVGTKFSVLRLFWTCYPVANVLYNTTTS